MKLKQLSNKLDIESPNEKKGLELYYSIRGKYIKRFNERYKGQFQSPTINPSTHVQRSRIQNDLEHSVYQRSDYTPISLEKQFNKFNKKIGDLSPITLAFSSGMAAISSIAYFLHNSKKIMKLSVGENVYFESGWIIKDYGRETYFDEYKLNLDRESDAYWVEFPINCTRPTKYPFNEQLNLNLFFKKIKEITSKNKKHIYLVIDYTLFYIPFNIERYIAELPNNLTVLLVSSLQKHRGYGLDLTNGGVVTIYSHNVHNDYEEFTKIRGITGTNMTQETAWLMPKINPKTINQLIVDSGKEAKRVYEECKIINSKVSMYYASSKKFLISFIFLEIDKDLMSKSDKKPYYSDLLISEIINSGKKNNAIILNGTSFGFPFTRIFKNSERYDNTSSIRIAIGHDSELNNNVSKSISEGINNFIKKYS